MGCFLYRRYQEDLQYWYYKKNRKPLVIRGARQVGKSTLVRQFCAQKKLKLYEVNLEKNLQLNEVFAAKNPTLAVEAIEDLLQIKMEQGPGSLLFLDEIQATPEAIACLRYFYEELPAWPVISAGSLLEFTLSDHEYSMPVGRIEYLHMGPMSFHEFLLAKNETFLVDRIRELKTFRPFSSTLHEHACNLLREYLFVGGMPEVVQAFITNGMDSVSEIHAQLLQTYQDDFVKYAKKSHLQKIQKVFRYILLNPCQKIKYANISQEDLARDLKSNLHLLFQAKVAHPVYHTSCQGLPLQATENTKIFKVLGLDVGLTNHAHGLQWSTFKKYGEHEILTEGVIAEQFVGQHLLDQRASYMEPHLNYWLREGKSHNAEVDYIIQREKELIAIEVKAGAGGKMRSLHQWMLECKYKQKRALRFNLSPGEWSQVSHRYGSKELAYTLLTLPLYFVEHWPQWLVKDSI